MDGWKKGGGVGEKAMGRSRVLSLVYLFFSELH